MLVIPWRTGARCGNFCHAVGMTGEAWEFVDGSGLLPGAVSSVTGYRSTDATPTLHRGLPSPTLTFIFSLDSPIVAGMSPQQAEGADAYRNDVVVGGLHTRPAYIAQPRVQTGIQLAVRPLASRALFGVPAAELGTSLISEGVDVLGPRAQHVREALAEADSWSRRFGILRQYLRHRLAVQQDGSGPRPEAVEAWKWLARSRGTGSMDGLARHVLLSRRQLGAVFHAEFGLSPKAAARLMRFENARRRVIRATLTGEHDIAAIAQTCGYYDHSHLVRDFRQYVGTSPTQWLAEELPNVQAAAPRDG